MLQLEAPSLHALRERVLAEHGPNARVIAAEKVTVGGIRGFFARHHYEATVEVDGESEGERASGGHVMFDLPSRVGLAALLESADGEEAALHAASTTPTLSTQAPDFAALMDNLVFNTASGPDAHAAFPAPPPVVPTLAAAAGDLVVIVGVAEAALAVARSMATLAGSSDVRLAGALAASTNDTVVDRRTATAARAEGVRGEQCVYVAFGITPGVGISRSAVTTLTRIDADQLWLAVDAGRKLDDTARWVTAIAAATPVHALAVSGVSATATPATVNELGIPVGWVDGAPAAATRL
ncbi:hypothetical protein ASC63_12415 [Leifsonia sp. Root112D2]|nr:hypothetical protein ASC63_12415 [Leifsonia sp. Root112D2]